jgi:mannosyltransferase OCH1-like enzyme
MRARLLQHKTFTPLRIENAQSASPSSLITADGVGVFNEQRCKIEKISTPQVCNQDIIEKNDSTKHAQIIDIYNIINKSFNTKESYNSVIPLKLYTSWHTKNLPLYMKANFKLLVETNPEFDTYIYDDADCREFIEKNFDRDVLFAYDSLIPYAYKADLWRLCILFINGGIYLDIKFKCVNGFKFIALTEKEYFVRDRNPIDTINGLIVCKPNNNILCECINKIVKNVKNKHYGMNSLEPTGPHLLGSFFNQEERDNMELYFDYTLIENVFSDYYIVYDNTIILSFYKEYREEQLNFQTKPHYSVLWVNNCIYKE